MALETTSSTSSARQTLVLIDGHALAYRMYFALEHTRMQSPAKVPTWAVFGFLNALFSLLQTIQPDALVVTFDTSRVSFRTEMYPEYKANRDDMPDDMRQQMELLTEGIEKLGIPIFKLKNYEADDVIGALARQASEQGVNVKILTGDQDAFQLVFDATDMPERGKVEVLIPPRSTREPLKTYDSEAVVAKWNITPEQVTDYKGLRGDASDNIPGVPGIGEKTAAKLLAQFPTLEAIYDDLNAVPQAKLREKLVQYEEQARLSKRLAEIDCYAPVELALEDCNLTIPDLPVLMDFFETHAFKAFKRQASSVLKPFLSPEQQVQLASTDGATLFDTPVAVSSDAKPSIETLKPNTPEFDYQVVTSEAALQELAQAVRTHGVMAIDLETTGLDALMDRVVGVAVSTGPGVKIAEVPVTNALGLSDSPAQQSVLETIDDAKPPLTVYIPLTHEVLTDTHTQLSSDVVWGVIGPLLSDKTIAVICQNAKFELAWFTNLGMPCNGLLYDTMIASYVFNPDRRHGLKALGRDILGLDMAGIDTLIGTGKKQIPFSQVPIDDGAKYGALDAYATWELARYFAANFDTSQQALLYEVELPLMRVLAVMEQAGIKLDTTHLLGLSQQLGQKITSLEADIYAMAGQTFNLNSPKQVGEVLFDKLEIPSAGKTKTKAYSTDAKVLEKLAVDYPIVTQLLAYRQFFKLKSTYIDALPKLIHPKTGRVHTSFNQTVTATGRLSSSDPNLQNIPIRSDEGRLIRQAFVPEDTENSVIVAADYSQIELRLLAHFSEDPHLVSAFCEGQDIHQATAALVFDVPLNEVTKEQRYQAKTVNFGVIYGQSAFSLSQQLGVTNAEAQAFISAYFLRYGQVKGFIDGTVAQAHEQGYVTTLCGRRRDLADGLKSRQKHLREFSERAAFNTVLQGSAADLLKVAMIHLQDALVQQGLQSKLLLQVHDEVVLEVPKSELDTVTAIIQDAMALEQPLRVPLVIDTNVGPSWMEV